MVATRTLLTADELFAVPKGEGKEELVRGEVRVMPPVGGEHGEVQLGLGVRMRLHADREERGFVVTETGFRLF
jgi:Uma2 family endonuclease